MPPHGTLKEAGFRCLIAGETVEVEGLGELILADFGFDRMIELIVEAVGVWRLMSRPDADQFVTIYRKPAGDWCAECGDCSWATSGPAQFVAETLGVHLQEEHTSERLDDFGDIFLGALYGLRGLSQAACGRSE